MGKDIVVPNHSMPPGYPFWVSFDKDTFEPGTLGPTVVGPYPVVTTFGLTGASVDRIHVVIRVPGEGQFRLITTNFAGDLLNDLPLFPDIDYPDTESSPECLTFDPQGRVYWTTEANYVASDNVATNTEITLFNIDPNDPDFDLQGPAYRDGRIYSWGFGNFGSEETVALFSDSVNGGDVVEHLRYPAGPNIFGEFTASAVIVDDVYYSTIDLATTFTSDYWLMAIDLNTYQLTFPFQFPGDTGFYLASGTVRAFNGTATNGSADAVRVTQLDRAVRVRS